VGDRGFEQRCLDALSFAGTLPMGDSRRDPERAEDTRGDIGNGCAGFDRRPAGPFAGLSLFGRASSTARSSLALISARRIFLSSEEVSNVISRLQCWQLVWNPLRILCARSRKTCEHFVHLIFTLSSVMKCPSNSMAAFCFP